MSFTLVMVEEHSRRTVQLRDDDPLDTINHKGTVVCHERNLSHVDFLLLDVLDGLVAGVFIVDHQTHFYSQRYGVSDAAQLTFFNIKNRFTQSIAYILEGRIP